jgi:hypothetical protein
LASTFATLAQRAKAGDTAAACRLATDIARCRTRAISMAAAEQLSAGLADPVVEHSGDGIGMVAAMLNHNAALEGLCGSADDAMLASGFRFQALAADTDPESARWLAANPALDPDNVVNELERWAEYRRRAAAYFDRSLGERRAEDLPLLLLVHAPGRHLTLRPPYRDEDPSTFLGLLSAAASLGMDVPDALAEEGRRLLAHGITADPSVVTGWRGEVPERMAPAVVRAMHPEVRGHEFCGSGPG